MSTETKTTASRPVPVADPLSVRDLAALLTKHYGLHEGAYNLMLEFQIGTGAVGPDVDHLVPGAMIGVSRIGLMPTATPGPNTVDAATVNPGRKSRRRSAG